MDMLFILVSTILGDYELLIQSKLAQQGRPCFIFEGGGVIFVFKYLLCSSLCAEMIQFDEHIFQMGWFNHQLV